MIDLRAETHNAKILADALRERGFVDDDDLICDSIEGETSAMEAVSRLLRWMALRTANSDALKAVEADFAARRRRYDESIDSARSALSGFMDEIGLQKIERPEATLSMRDGGKPVNYAGDFDPAKLPEKFQRIKIEADKKAIKEAMEAGEEVEGAVFGNAPRVLTIRTK